MFFVILLVLQIAVLYKIFLILRKCAEIYFNPNIGFHIGRCRLFLDEAKGLYQARVRIGLISKGTCKVYFNDLLLNKSKKIVDENLDNWVEGIYLAGQDTEDQIFTDNDLYFEAKVVFTKNNIKLFEDYIELIEKINEQDSISAYYYHPLTNERITINEKLFLQDYIKSCRSDMNQIK